MFKLYLENNEMAITDVIFSKRSKCQNSKSRTSPFLKFKNRKQWTKLGKIYICGITKTKKGNYSPIANQMISGTFRSKSRSNIC
jgi:hypothetical protein